MRCTPLRLMRQQKNNAAGVVEFARDFTTTGSYELTLADGCYGADTRFGPVGALSALNLESPTRWAGARFIVVGEGNDNATIELKLFHQQRKHFVGGDAAQNGFAAVNRICTLAATLSTLQCSGAQNPLFNWRIADTLVLTRSPWLVSMESALGFTSLAHSPGGNAEAFFILPDLMDASELLLDMNLGAGVTRANVLVQYFAPN